MQKSKIEWTDSTWNPITGCTPASEGCKNCYAKKIAETRLKMPDFSKITYYPERLNQITPRQKPKRVFVCSMGDLFHKKVKHEWQIDILLEMVKCSQHTFIILTKRPEEMRLFFDYTYLSQFTLLKRKYPLNNLWLGVTCENQKSADERIPILLSIPAKVHFVSCEPLLEEIDLIKFHHLKNVKNKISWVIAGCETGTNRRPTEHDWIDSLICQCETYKMPIFVKQIEENNKIIKCPKINGKQYLNYPAEAQKGE
jgi:protein gp37